MLNQRKDIQFNANLSIKTTVANFFISILKMKE